MKDVRITCPVCLRKFPYKELPHHLAKAHPRSLWRIYATELRVSEEERKLIFRAIKEAEEE